MPVTKAKALTVGVAALLAACGGASVSPKAANDDTSRLVEAHTGRRVTFRQGSNDDRRVVWIPGGADSGLRSRVAG